MKINEKGLEIIRSFEGCRLSAYRCSAGVLTIGYGHTSGVYEGMKITQEEAEDFLLSDLRVFEHHVENFDDKYHWSSNEFSALVSFAFNIGSINGLTANGTRSKATIADKIPLYDKCNGKRLEGLRRRREAERALFLNGSGSMEDERVISLKRGDI